MAPFKRADKPASRRVRPAQDNTPYEIPQTRAKWESQRRNFLTSFPESNIRGCIDNEPKSLFPFATFSMEQTKWPALDFDSTRKSEPSSVGGQYAKELSTLTESYTPSWRALAGSGKPNPAFRSEIQGISRRLEPLVRWQRNEEGELVQSSKAAQREKMDQDDLFAVDTLLMMSQSQMANSPLHRTPRAGQPRVTTSPATRQSKNVEGDYSCGTCERIEDRRRTGMGLLLQAIDIRHPEQPKEAAPIIKKNSVSISPHAPHLLRIKPIGGTVQRQQLAGRSSDQLVNSLKLRNVQPQQGLPEEAQEKAPPYSSSSRSVSISSPVPVIKKPRMPLPTKRSNKRTVLEDFEQSETRKRARVPTLKAREASCDTSVTPVSISEASGSRSQSNISASTSGTTSPKTTCTTKPRDPAASPSSSTAKERLRGDRIARLGFENPNGPCRFCAAKGKKCYVLPKDIANRPDLMDILIYEIGIRPRDLLGRDKRTGFRCHDCTSAKRSGKMCNAGSTEERRAVKFDS